MFSDIGGGDVFGYGGDDLLMAGNSGHYAFHGGSGHDTVAYVNATQGMTLALDPHLFSGSTLTNHGAATGDTYNSIENVVGTKYNDTIYGDAHDNKIYGGGGNDTINAGGGNDTINGGANNDTVWGQLGGNDTVTGGSGKDIFNFDIVGGHNFNLTITDFHPQVWTGNTAPTLSQALADTTHDVLEPTFEPSTGVTTDAQADAAFVLTNGEPDRIVGHDVIFTVHTGHVDGTITLQGAADLLVDSNHHFTVYDFAVHAV